MVAILSQLHFVNEMFHYTTQEVTSDYWQENEASPNQLFKFHTFDWLLSTIIEDCLSNLCGQLD